MGFIVAFLVVIVVLNAWANASIFGWGSGLALLVLVPVFWLVRNLLRNRASRLVQRTMDPGRGYSGRSTGG